jgi:crotonobetainyl-CoA:carnitine CoA-transferase CaiB-like acyl-CoA transferase
MVVAGRPELSIDPRFSTARSMHRNIAALKRELAEAVTNWTYVDLEKFVKSAGGTIVPVTQGGSAVEFAKSCGLFEQGQDPITALTRPWRFFDSPIREA